MWLAVLLLPLRHPLSVHSSHRHGHMVDFRVTLPERSQWSTCSRQKLLCPKWKVGCGSVESLKHIADDSLCIRVSKKVEITAIQNRLLMTKCENPPVSGSDGAFNVLSNLGGQTALPRCNLLEYNVSTVYSAHCPYLATWPQWRGRRERRWWWKWHGAAPPTGF